MLCPGVSPRLIGGVGTTAHGFIPAHKWSQSNAKGQEPQHSDESSCPLAGHQTIIPTASRKKTKIETLSK